jgi:hypothetical protein
VIRILRQRRIAAVKYEDLKKMGVVLKRARFFITCDGRYYGDNVLEPVYLRERILAGDRVPPSMRVTDLRLDSRRIRTALGGGEKPQISMFEFMAADRPSLPDARPPGCPNDRAYAIENRNAARIGDGDELSVR